MKNIKATVLAGLALICACAIGADDAYLESDGTQAINTGYHMNGSARVEGDFEMWERSNTVLFGAWNCKIDNNSGENRLVGPYIANGSSTQFQLGLSGSGSSGATNAFKTTNIAYIDSSRHMAIVDAKNCRMHWVTGTTTNNTITLTYGSPTPANGPTAIFGAATAADGTAITQLGKARFYSFRIYENDSLVHEYLPYRKGSVVGMYDTQTGEIKTDVLGSASPFKFGSAGGHYTNVCSSIESVIPASETEIRALPGGGCLFTAPADGEYLGSAYECAGYVAETLEGGEWVSPRVVAGTNAVEVSGDGDVVRITWLWRETRMANVEAAKDVGDYVADGLVLHYDGIRNAGADEAHDARATVWKNVAPGRDGQFDLRLSSVKRGSPGSAWLRDGFRFEDGYAKWYYNDGENPLTLPAECTIQLLVDATSAEQGADSWYGYTNENYATSWSGADEDETGDNRASSGLHGDKYSAVGYVFFLPGEDMWKMGSLALRRDYYRHKLNFVTDGRNGASGLKRVWIDAEGDDYTVKHGFAQGAAFKYATAILSAEKGKSMLFSGTTYPTASWDATNAVQTGTYFANASAPSDASATRFVLGGKGELDHYIGAGDSEQSFKGVIKSFRMYGRVLTEAEIAANRAVDEARFFGAVAATNAVVASLPAGLGGMEPCGAYAVTNAAGHVFAAPSFAVGADGRVFRRSESYLQQQWSAASNTWERGELVAGASRTVLPSEKVRITWIYEPEPVVGVVGAGAGAGDYVQDGLVVHYDGIRNVGADAAHCPDSVFWHNLASSSYELRKMHYGLLDAGLYAYAAATDGGAWAEDGFVFDGKTYFAAREYHGDMSNMFATVQVRGDFAGTVQTGEEDRGQLFLPGGDRGFGYGSVHVADGSMALSTYNRLGSSPTPGSHPSSFTAVMDGARAAGFEGDALPADGWASLGAGRELQLANPGFRYLHTTLGGYHANNHVGGTSAQCLVGKVCSVRYYDRVLADAELKFNNDLDRLRFEPLAATNVVVEGEFPGGMREAPGAYKVNGAWTFSADGAWIEADRKPMRLDGYTLREWDPDAGDWGEEEFHLGEGECSYSYTNGVSPAKVLLSWRWVVPRTNAVVQTSLDFLPGYEEGVYTLDEPFSFSAPTNWNRHGNGYACGGYVVEEWDAANGRWGAPEVVRGTNAVAVAPDEDVRVTWIWNETRMANVASAKGVGDYVTDGLVLHSDGILNAGADAAHDGAATVWRNIAPGREGQYDLEFDSVFRGSPYSMWLNDGYRFGDGYAKWFYNSADAPLTLPAECTIQLLIDATSAEQSADTWYDYTNSALNKATTGLHGDKYSAVGYVFFLPGGDMWKMGSIALRRDYYRHKMNFVTDGRNGSSGLKRVWMDAAGDNYTTKEGLAQGAAFKYATAILSASKGKSMLFSGTTYPAAAWDATNSVQTGTYFENEATPVAASVTRFVLGGKGEGERYVGANDSEQSFRGVLKSFRMYSRALGEDEIAANRAVDEARFFGAAAATNAVISSMPAGLGGMEGCGRYAVTGDGHMFSAPALAVGEDGRMFAYSGSYLLQRWNAESNTWERGEAVTGSSRLVLPSEKVRLTWMYDMTPVKGLVGAGTGEGDYVQDGLLLHYDGIRNIGIDAAHCTNSIFWRNLASSSYELRKMRYFDLEKGAYAYASATNGGIWADDGFVFDGTTYFLARETHYDMSNLFSTVQLRGDFGGTTQTGQNDRGQLFLPGGERSFGYGSVYVQSGSMEASTYLRIGHSPTVVAGAHPTSFAAVMDGARAIGFEGDALPSSGWTTLKSGSAFTPANASGYQHLALGGYHANNHVGGTNAQCLVGKLSSVRYYDRVLADAELKWNNDLDAQRFEPLAVTNVVVAGEFPGGMREIPGAYEVKGAWTFSGRKARRESDGRLMRLDGYTVREWNESTGDWGDVVEARSGEDACAYTYTEGVSSAKVLLTWRWAEWIPGGVFILYN